MVILFFILFLILNNNKRLPFVKFHLLAMHVRL